MKILFITTLLIFLSIVETKRKKQQLPILSILDSSQFEANAKIGFRCRKVQVPLFRSHKKRPTVMFESTKIIKLTKISVSGEIMFDLVCFRDTRTDKGDLPDPIEAEIAAQPRALDEEQDNDDEDASSSTTTENDQDDDDKGDEASKGKGGDKKAKPKGIVNMDLVPEIK